MFFTAFRACYLIKNIFILYRMREEKILISSDGPDNNVLKFKPPMVFTTQDVDRLVDTLDRVLAELDDTVSPVSNLKLEVKITISQRVFCKL